MATSYERALLGASLAGLSVLLSACASYKLAEPAAPIEPALGGPGGLATICVVRTAVHSMAVTMPTHDNGKLVGATRGPSRFCYYAEPGEHDITIEADELAVAHLVAEPEGRYYLKVEVDNILGWVQARPVWITEGVAREDFDDSIYRVLVGVPGTETLPGEVPIAPAKPLRATAAATATKG